MSDTTYVFARTLFYTFEALDEFDELAAGARGPTRTRRRPWPHGASRRASRGSRRRDVREGALRRL
jgi:hypothetical protein